MKHLYILNPEGNEGKGRVTRYVGRGEGISARIELIDLLYQAHKDAQELVDKAQEEGAEYVDISGPAHVASIVKAELYGQATNN